MARADGLGNNALVGSPQGPRGGVLLVRGLPVMFSAQRTRWSESLATLTSEG